MPAMPEPEDRKLTFEDYWNFPEDGLRHELLDGVHVVNAAPSLKHQDVIRELALQIGVFLKQHPRGKLYFAPTAVKLTPYDGVEPDLVFVAAEHLSRLVGTHIDGPPDLVIEVHSSNKRYDVVDKRARYQLAGVPEYWLVDPELDSVEVLRLDAAGVYQTAQRLALHTGGGLIETPLLPGLRLDLTEVFLPES